MDYRKDFPIFENRPDLVYFDNGASAQKPKAVIDAVNDFYEKSNSNIHRGPHFLAEEATILYEDAKRTVADFIGAPTFREIVFTRNATEAINLVAHSYGSLLKEGEVVVLSKLEHHANIVPWLQLKERIGIRIRYFDFDDEGRLVFDPDLIDEDVALVSVSGMSNTLGTLTDLPPIIKAAHAVGAKVLVDAAQLVVHKQVNVHQLDIDFLVFTGHKLYGPTGIGVLYAKDELLQSMPPFLGGGDMIKEVYSDHYIPAASFLRFEAGTPNIAGAIGLKAAIDYMLDVGLDHIHKIESRLTDHLLSKMTSLPYLNVIGPKENKARGSIVSFTMKGVHPHDIAEGLSQRNICIRAGQHCTQPLHDQCKIPATARASLAFYNTEEEIDKCCTVLEEIHTYFN